MNLEKSMQPAGLPVEVAATVLRPDARGLSTTL